MALVARPGHGHCASQGARPARGCARAVRAVARPPAGQPRPFAAAARQRSTHAVRSSAGDAPADQTKELSQSAFDFEEPETAREAIDLGLVLCKQEKWEKALAVFQKALSLPGTGVKRFRDKPRLISDSERMAALYNTACCHARLGQGREGLLALSACLEAGYADYEQISVDPDLELLRQDPRFSQLLQRYQPKGGSFLGIKLPW